MIHDFAITENWVWNCSAIGPVSSDFIRFYSQSSRRLAILSG
jgi:hypothetical protein